MATKAQLKPFFQKIYERSDSIIEKLLYAYFAFGIGLSFIYDTYAVGIGVGMLSMALYFSSKHLFKGTTVNQYVASLVAGLFMAQFIYQMHGLFEMHFTAFIAIIALITYQNKFAFIPQLLFVVIHHSSFAYIQYLGYINENEAYKRIYFTQLEFMDFQTFLFHAGLYAVGVVLAAIYTHNLEKNTIENAENIIKLQTAEDRMNENIEFAKRISEGEFNYEYTLQEGDQMGSALVSMNSNLKESSIREKQESFKNIGLAEIGDIIRNHSESLDELTYQIVSYLVKYMKLNQGGVFILNDDDEDNKFLELKGCYAYERKKFLEKRISIGEGLIGQCYLERNVIYLRDVPKDYVRITSGLGDAPPSNLLIVPIKNEDSIEGVMELASFRLLEQYEIDFLKRACENIATTIASAKINAKTRLLYEESQQQTEEMRAQEEEMRQNMEELQATQEEMERVSGEMSEQIKIIDSTMATIEFDLEGNIQDANENFLQLMRYNKNEIIGKHHRIFVNQEDSSSQAYSDFWKSLARGEASEGEFKRVAKGGKEVWIKGMYSPMLGTDMRPIKVVKFAYDITQQKKQSIEIEAMLKESQEQTEELRAQEEEMRQNMEEIQATQEEMERVSGEMSQQIQLINATMATIEFDLEGNIKDANENFLKLMEYNKNEIIGKHHRIFVTPEDSISKAYGDFWRDLALGKASEGEFKRIAKGGREVWIKGMYRPMKDLNGTPIKVVKFAYDVTEEHNQKAQVENLLEESQQQTEELRAQEEEMRQNMEELQAIQDELERTSTQFRRKYEAINNSGVGSIEFDLHGNIVDANEAFCELMKYSKDEIIGKHHRIFVNKKFAQSQEYKVFWKDLENGKLHKGKFTRYDKTGNEITLLGAYSVLKNDENEPKGVLKFAMDISHLKN